MTSDRSASAATYPWPTYPLWGWASAPTDAPSAADLDALAPLVAAQLGLPTQSPETPAELAELPADRIGAVLPSSLRSLASADPLDRARHGVGRSYRDVLRGLRGRLDHVPDLVLRPRTESDIAAILDWCASATVAVVPFGGGTSVVGGVEPDVGGGWAGVVSLDLVRLSGIVEVDAMSRAARVLAGTSGPALETALRDHDLTARFYPQSFERSTVGGWIATRAAGHFSTGPTHVDDLVESIRAVTPSGEWSSRRLPASGAGPSPDRLLLGSEGALGIISETWLRLQPRPTQRWSGTFAVADFGAGLRAVRSIAQSGLQPATCRLIDAAEAAISGTRTTGEAVLVAGLESWSAPVDAERAEILERCRAAGMHLLDGDAGGDGSRHDAGVAWRSSFLRAPYLREQLVLLGLIVETFETAATWDRIEALIDSVIDTTRRALDEVCGGGTVTCRITHVYPDGAAPYFTVIAPGRRGSELSQWAEIKAAASAAIMTGGGTITHHHAVGRDHRQWYDEQRPPPFAAALTGAKQALDPSSILNPGVLVQTAPTR